MSQDFDARGEVIGGLGFTHRTDRFAAQLSHRYAEIGGELVEDFGAHRDVANQNVADGAVRDAHHSRERALADLFGSYFFFNELYQMHGIGNIRSVKSI